MTFIRAAALALFASLLPPLASAQTLYKLVDKAGKVSYVDRIPKGFDGQVTPLLIDPATNANTPVRVAPPAKTETPEVRDRNTERRDARAKLRLALDRAAARVDAARLARDAGVEPLDDEYQTIQQKFDASKAKANAPGPRSNCMRQGAIWICPTIVPGDKYRDRQKELDDAVRQAEIELAQAEEAYRRGTD